MPVVIVESPAKAKTINAYLGSKYQVLASFGHVRDLPPKDGSVRPDEDFAMTWQVDPKAQKRLSDIAKAVKGSDRLILATDPDREGEAISWHVLDVLREKNVLKDIPVERVVFNAITKESVKTAMENPRKIDTALVEAYLARRALDYLVGFTLSPVLWRKLPGARSAGRVQSVSLRLVCDREEEIEAFKPQEYWSVETKLLTAKNESFTARIVSADGKKLDRLSINSEAQAKDLRGVLESAQYKVETIEAKPVKRNPSPPFTTSTLQQEASRKLGFSPAHTMRVAQRLYEGITIGGETVGLITYMRTDGLYIAPEAITSARDFIGKKYGAKYVPDSPRLYKTKQKNAQEAHEAIRPTKMARLPADVKNKLDSDHAALYELIWIRTIASQMESAEMERTTAEITATSGARKAQLRAIGSVVVFDGFLTLYQEGEDDSVSEDDRRLPALAANDNLKLEDVVTLQHFTEPPPRYTEASLVKKMEELGIGRPSTYASILAVLRERGYVILDKKRLYPDNKGRIVTAFLKKYFQRYVTYDFTANLEEELDEISSGDKDWRDVLRRFWTAFSNTVAETKELRVSDVIDVLNEQLAPLIFPPKEDGSDPRTCPSCADGKLSLKLGKFGSFIGCSNYPECKFTRQLTAGGDGALGSDEKGTMDGANKILGDDPDTGLQVTLRQGRFGPYVQLGDEEKPRRTGIPKGVSPPDVDLEYALKLLTLPREIGKHPESGEKIVANLGRFGPYIQHQKTYVNVKDIEEIFDIGINRAVDMIAEKIAKGPGRGFGGRSKPKGKVLGEHPEGGEIALHSGRYGPYVSHEKTNATLPKHQAEDTLTLQQAIILIDLKNGGATKGKKKPAKKVAKKAANDSKPKKPARKKAANE
ncbi:MAG: type I DNA topoisomerase [Pseudomonadota bacterium]